MSESYRILHIFTYFISISFYNLKLYFNSPFQPTFFENICVFLCLLEFKDDSFALIIIKLCLCSRYFVCRLFCIRSLTDSVQFFFATQFLKFVSLLNSVKLNKFFTCQPLLRVSCVFCPRKYIQRFSHKEKKIRRKKSQNLILILSSLKNININPM